MVNDNKPRIRKTPNGRHLYTAALKGYATYGWGNTPAEARAKLQEMLAKYGEVRVEPTYSAAALAKIAADVAAAKTENAA